MDAKFDIDQIRKYWTSQAATHGASHKASWSDTGGIELEQKAILGYIQDGDTVLDAGCANGHSTLVYASKRNIEAVGVDYIPEMVDKAQANLAQAPGLEGRVRFQQADVRALPFGDGLFDKIVTTRVVINMQSWEGQVAAVQECARVTRPGGLLLLSEATVQGNDGLNRLREEMGLASLKTPDFNLYLDVERMAGQTWDGLTLLDIVDFSSTYYLVTRVIKPLLAQLPGSKLDVFDPSCEINRLAGALPSWGDYGVQKLFVLRKSAQGSGT